MNNTTINSGVNTPNDNCKKNRVCCLYRVSTIGQVEKNDIPMQKTACREFAQQMGWRIVQEHQEKGVSGYKISAENRDAVQDIKRAALAGEFDILLVFMFDRLGRREDETPFVVQWFVQHGIQVWSKEEGEQRFDNHVDKLMNYIRFWQASGESEKTSIRTRTRMEQMVKEGRFKGGCRPYGYQLVKSGRVNKKGNEVYDLEIDPYEASVVNEIFELYTNKGMGTHRLAMYLTSRGIQSMSGSWHPATILHMLKNPLYTGILRSGKSYSEPFDNLRIVSDDLFNRARILIEQRSRKDRTVPISSKSRSLLSGNVFCGHCGSRLTPTSSGRAYTKQDGTEVQKRSCYVCYGSTRKRKDCNGPRSYSCRMVDEIVEGAIRAIFTKLNDDPSDTIMSVLSQRKEVDTTQQLKIAVAELQEAEKILVALKKELVKSVMGSSLLSQEDVNASLQDQKKEVEALKHRVDMLRQESNKGSAAMSKFQDKLDRIRSWAEMFDSADLATKKMIVSNLIERVVVSRDYQIQIVMNSELQELLLNTVPAGIPEAINIVA